MSNGGERNTGDARTRQKPNSGALVSGRHDPSSLIPNASKLLAQPFNRNATLLAVHDMVDGLQDKELSGAFHYLKCIYKTRPKKRSFYGVH